MKWPDVKLSGSTYLSRDSHRHGDHTAWPHSECLCVWLDMHLSSGISAGLIVFLLLLRKQSWYGSFSDLPSTGVAHLTTSRPQALLCYSWCQFMMNSSGQRGGWEMSAVSPPCHRGKYCLVDLTDFHLSRVVRLSLSHRCEFDTKHSVCKRQTCKLMIKVQKAAKK